jgi:alcohol dehydrogenase (cytochrome c)
MNYRWFLCAAWVLGSAAGAQGFTASMLAQRPAQDWPSYHGDYTGDHFSALRQIDSHSVARLGLAWSVRIDPSTRGAIEGGTGARQSSTPTAFSSVLKATPVELAGVLYMVAGPQVFALDARTGATIWHYYWASSVSSLLGRGVAVDGHSVYVQTGNDNYVVSLDAQTGHERWRRQITDSSAGYQGTTAPMIVGHHLLVGMGGDGNNLGAWLEALDPDTGAPQWRWFTAPSAGDPALATWPDRSSAQHGGGMPWQEVTYDPMLNLIYVPTANPVPVLSGAGRAGNNLYTDSIVALDADSGKLVWYFQATPHDVHDYDATQVPMLIDAPFNGSPRRLLAQFDRNGLYFLLDRQSGKNLLTQPFIPTANWYRSIGANGQPQPDPGKFPQPGGALLSPMSDGATNYPASSYDPQTRLAYSQANTSFSLFYLDPEDQHPAGWSGGSEYHTGYVHSALLALNPVSGQIVWRHDWPDLGFINAFYPGVLTTAGGLLFTGDPVGDFIAFDARRGLPVWHSLIGQIRNTPISYALDGRQYVLVATDQSLFAFALNDQ